MTFRWPTCSSNQSGCTTVAPIPARIRKTIEKSLFLLMSRVSTCNFAVFFLCYFVVYYCFLTSEWFWVCYVQCVGLLVPLWTDLFLVSPQLKVFSLSSWIRERSYQLRMRPAPVWKPVFLTTPHSSTVPGTLLIKLWLNAKRRCGWQNTGSCMKQCSWRYIVSTDSI